MQGYEDKTVRGLLCSLSSGNQNTQQLAVVFYNCFTRLFPALPQNSHCLVKGTAASFNTTVCVVCVVCCLCVRALSHVFVISIKRGPPVAGQTFLIV